MKKIGIVGGISWASTIEYYRFINQETNNLLGGLNFAECMIYSVNFDHFRKYNADHNWDAAFDLLLNAALHLQTAGADVLLLGANTAHIVAEKISERISCTLLDIRTVTAQAISGRKLKKVGLLGTIYTMELDFYRTRIEHYGLEVIIPENKSVRLYIEKTLQHELGKGIILPATKSAYIQIANNLIERGAEGIILGCTEIPLILTQEDIPVPVFNTTHIHAKAAVQLALSEHMSIHDDPF